MTARLSLEELAGELIDFRDDVLVTAAALQLTAENQTKWARFVRLLEVAHAIGPSTGGSELSMERLRRVLKHGPVADSAQVMAEDPSEEPFVGCIQFFGGSYRVLSGGTTGAHVGCQLVLEATRQMGALGHKGFAERVFQEAQVLLSLSEEACRRADLQRFVGPADRLRSNVFLPGREALDQLKGAVVFTPDECVDLIGADLEAVIKSLTLDFQLTPADGERETPVDDRLYGVPLGRTQHGSVVLALPGGVTMSIIHRALISALDAGIGADLVDCLRRAQLESLHRILTSMRWERVAPPDGLGPSTGFTEGFYLFDEKLAHVCSVVDTLDDYEAGSPFDFSPMSDVVEELRNRLAAVRDAFRVVPDRGSVLHLISIATLGRSSAMAFSGDEIDDESELLTTNLGDLDVMAWEADADPLGLWSFVRAQQRLHDRTHVFSFSTLDQFAIYRSHGDGFYLSDDEPPTMMSVQSDMAAPLRIEVAQRRDVHAALLPDKHGVGLVERWQASSEQAIYRPLSQRYGCYHLVEDPAPLWIVPAETEGPERQHAEDLVEAVAFWLWKCSALTAEPLRTLSERGIQPVIEVHAEVSDPASPPDLEPLADWLAVEIVGQGRLACRFGKGAGNRFDGPGNAAERMMAREVVAGLYRLAGLGVPPDATWPEVLGTDSLVKMVHVFGPDADPVLALGLGARPRLLRPSSVELVLDQVGEAMCDNGLLAGAIEPTARNGVLNDSVAWAFRELWSLLQSLQPGGLLEMLAHETESIIFAAARANLLVPSQTACFGADSAAVARSRTHITGMATTAIANRFIVEVVTAAPPNGPVPLSLEIYDRLIALANQIVEFGFLSDAIRSGLSSERMTLLASGRLGFDRADAFQAARSEFFEIVGTRAMASAVTAYPSNWRPPSSGDYDAGAIDAAYTAEFGISATDLSMVIGDMVQYASDADGGVAVRGLADLQADLSGSTGLPDQVVAAGLSLLSLEPVEGFDPARVPRDSYPWRFSRNRSMVRRPMMVRVTASGPEAVWGPRATWRAGRYLLQQVTSARDSATTPEMRDFVGAFVRQAGAEFNSSVADVLRAAGFDDVREQVDRVGALRFRRPSGEEIGDVDVMVIDRSRRVLLAVEAKDFELARTPQELANEVQKLIGERGSAAAHHNERLRFLHTHLPRLLKELQIADDPTSWDVQGMVVTSADLLGTHYLRASRLAGDLRLTSVHALRERTPSQLMHRRDRKNPAKAAKRRRRKQRKRR